MAVSPDKIYFLRFGNDEWRHVSKSEWVRAERGWYVTFTPPGKPALYTCSDVCLVRALARIADPNTERMLRQ